MNSKGKRVDSRAIGRAFAEKFKNLGKGEMAFQDIQDSIWEVLQANGIEIPDKVKQAVKDYQPKTLG